MKCTQPFEQFLLGISVPFDFTPAFSGIFGGMVCILENELSGNFQRILVPLVTPFSKVPEFLIEPRSLTSEQLFGHLP